MNPRVRFWFGLIGVVLAVVSITLNGFLLGAAAGIPSLRSGIIEDLIWIGLGIIALPMNFSFMMDAKREMK